MDKTRRLIVSISIICIVTFCTANLSFRSAYAADASGTCPGKTCTRVFKDLGPDYWAYDEICSLKAENIALGYPDGTFRPSDHISRIEFMVLLARITDRMEILYYPDEFKDSVSYGGYDLTVSWAYPEWKRLSRRYEMTRYPEADFDNPGIDAINQAFGGNCDLEGDMTRYEAAALLLPFLVRPLPDTDEESVIFNDTGSCPDETCLRMAAAYKLIFGYPDGSYRPDHPISRAEAFVILLRFMDKCDFIEASDSYRPHRDELRTIFGNIMYDRYLDAAAKSTGFIPSYPIDDFDDLRCMIQNVFMLEIACDYDMSSSYYTMPGYVEYFDDFTEFYKHAPENRLYDPSKVYLKNASRIFTEIIDINQSRKLAHLKVISRDEDGFPTAYSSFRYLVMLDGRWLIDFNGTDMGSGNADDPCEIIKNIPGFIDFDCDRYGIRIEI